MFFKSTQLQQALGTDTKDKRLTDMHELKSKIKKKKRHAYKENQFLKVRAPSLGESSESSPRGLICLRGFQGIRMQI